MFTHLADRDTGIRDPNFLWELLAQSLLGLALAFLVAWVFLKIIKKIFPNIRPRLQIAFVALMLVALVIILGLVSENLQL